MKVIGFNFTKISINDLRGSSESSKDIKANTGMDILDIKEVKPGILKTNDKVFSADFEHKVDYEPDFAKVEIKGRILIAVEPKLAKQIVKEWKDKKLPEDFRLFLFNIILRKSSLKALELEDELNLPLHIPMPSFRKEEPKKD